jgi:hypothetical protein
MSTDDVTQEDLDLAEDSVAKITRTTKEEFDAPPSIRRRRRLPDDNDISIPEEDAIREALKHDFKELCPLIGDNEYESWRIVVKRVGPPNFNGYSVQSGVEIDSITAGMTWDQLQTRIKANNGGGSYSLHLYDGYDKSRKKKALHISGLDPLMSEEECPGYFKFIKKKEAEREEKLEEEKLRLEEEKLRRQNEPDPEEREIKAEIRKTRLHKQLEKERLAGETEEVEEADHREASESVLAAMIRSQSEQTVAMIQTMGAQNKGNGNSDMLAMMQMQMNMMMEMSKQQQANSDRMMQVMLAQNNGGGSHLDLMKTMMEGAINKGDTFVNLINGFMPAMLEILFQGKEDENPKMTAAKEIFNMASEGIQKLTDLYGTMSDARGILPPAGGSPGLPYGQRPAPAPQPKPVPRPQPNQQAGPRVNPNQPGPAAAPPRNPEPMTDDVFDQIASMMQGYTEEQRIGFVINCLLQEAEGTPAPMTSGFCYLFSLDTMPEIIDDIISVSHTSAELRENLANNEVIAMEVPAQLRTMFADLLEKNIFNNQVKTKWLGDCLQFIHANFMEQDVYPDDIVADTPGEVFGDPSDDNVVVNETEPWDDETVPDENETEEDPDEPSGDTGEEPKSKDEGDPETEKKPKARKPAAKKKDDK